MAASDIPEAFQEVINLGAPKKVYRVGCLAAIGKAGSAAALAFILLLMVLFAIASPFLADDPVTGIAGGLFLLSGAMLAGYFFWKPFRRTARSLQNIVVLYEEGFAVSAGGERPRSFAWNAVRKVTAQIVRQTIYGIIPAGTDYRLTVWSDDPDPVELDSPLGGVEELYRAIRENAVPRITAEAVAQFREGKTLAFGPIRANRAQGMLLKDRVLAWGDIRDVQFGNRILLISPKSGGVFSKWMYEDGTVPNIDALLAVCREAGVAVK
jgi:hypothetical protein